jgi:prepilin peptidase dependent protein B
MLKPGTTRQPMRSIRGVSIVELMIGLALGLFVVGGGLLMLAGFTDENRRLLLETRLNQDLRAASDVVTRDLRRAGYWNAAHTGVWATGGPAVPPQNPYSRMDGTACAGANLAPGQSSTTTLPSAALCYALEATVDATPGAIDNNERFGFEVDGGVIYTVADGGARQALTDPKSIAISDLVITPSSQVLDASSYCKTACNPAAVGANCPQVVVREYEVLIKGNLPGDAGINRFLRSNVRIRNDHFGGQCPA